MAFWTYILRCADDSYYTGHTDNLEQRIGQHETGAISSCYTFKRRPLILLFSQEFTTREEALTAELQIKGWSRKKKEAMMRGDWAEVSRLAKSVRPEPVEGYSAHDAHPLSVHGSTSSPRTEATVRPEPPNTVRPEPVEGRSSRDVHAPSAHPSTLRQAQDSGRTEGGES